MTRYSNVLLVVAVAACAGCTFEAGAGGYVFKPPKDTVQPPDTPDPGPDLGQACFDYFACLLTVATQGGSVEGCAGAAPEELAPYLEALEECRAARCNELMYDPESASFVPVAFRNCLKYNCAAELLGCMAHSENREGCQKYVVCEQQCADTGVVCDLTCMKKLGADDVESTVSYLGCMQEFATIPEGGGITDKLCECLAICEVPYPVCDDRPQGG
jgi:hypothetical protein